MTEEQIKSIEWMEDHIRGKRLGASTIHLKNILELIGEINVEVDQLRNGRMPDDLRVHGMGQGSSDTIE